MMHWAGHIPWCTAGEGGVLIPRCTMQYWCRQAHGWFAPYWKTFLLIENLHQSSSAVIKLGRIWSEAFIDYLSICSELEYLQNAKTKGRISWLPGERDTILGAQTYKFDDKKLCFLNLSFILCLVNLHCLLINVDNVSLRRQLVTYHTNQYRNQRHLLISQTTEPIFGKSVISPSVFHQYET